MQQIHQVSLKVNVDKRSGGGRGIFRARKFGLQKKLLLSSKRRRLICCVVIFTEKKGLADRKLFNFLRGFICRGGFYREKLVWKSILQTIWECWDTYVNPQPSKAAANTTFPRSGEK